MHFTRYYGLTDNVGILQDLSWEQICREFATHDRRKDKNGPLFNLVRFDRNNGRIPGKGDRIIEMVLEASGLVLDLDHLPQDLALSVVKRFADLECLMVSTHSSAHDQTFGEVAMRVVIPFNRSATKAELDKAWLIARQSFPDLTDKQFDSRCREPAHFYFLPSCKPGSQPFTHHSSGLPIDLDSQAFRDFRPANQAMPTVVNEGLPSPSQPGAGYHVSDAAFTKAIKGLARSKKPTAAAFEALAAGLAFADPGSRDQTLFWMCSELAEAFPKADPSSIARQFSTSLSFMALQAPDGALTEAQVAYKFERAVANLTTEQTLVEILCTSTGAPVACDENIRRILEADGRVMGLFRENQFNQRVVVFRQPPWAETWAGPRDIADTDITALCAWLMAEYRLNCKPNMVYSGVMLAASVAGWHPVREYLAKCSQAWDGVPRLDSWLIDHMGAEDTPYSRKVGSWWLMQAVARVMTPGCQADYTLIFEGKQGLGKSQTLKALASPEWFSSSLIDLGTKASGEQLAGKWILEIGELSELRRADVNRVKNWLTIGADRFREAYGRCAKDYQRQCVFAGSTNDVEYLLDKTGNRRFWPIRTSVTHVNREGLDAVRDQLWAEAANRWGQFRLAQQAGTPDSQNPYRFWPDESDEDQFAAEVEKRREVDCFEESVLAWVENPLGYKQGQVLTTRWMLEHVMNLDSPRAGDDTRMRQVLFACGFQRTAGRAWLPPKALAVDLAPVLHLRSV